jgi:hypothetical protein
MRLSTFAVSFLTASDNGSKLRQQTHRLLSTTAATHHHDNTVLTDSVYDNLLDWLEQAKGAKISVRIRIQPSTLCGGGHGVFVTDTVAAGELLFEIPRSACITMDDAINDPECGRAFQRVMERAGPGGNKVALAGFVAKERLLSLYNQQQQQQQQQGNDSSSQQSSSFGPYLSTLPWAQGTNGQEHVLFWSNEKVDNYLSGSMCYEETKELRNEVETATRVLEGIMGKVIQKYRGELVESSFSWPWQSSPQEKNKEFTYTKGLPEAVTGAFVSLLTRSFEDPGTDDDKLVPMLDLLQHSDTPNISHAMRADTKAVQVRARRTLEAGEELLNQYRSEADEIMPYHRFFTFFGFVPGIQEPVENLLSDKSSIFFAQRAQV